MDTSKPTSCQCATLADLAAVPMGGDGLDELVFDSLERVCDHSRDLWWLYLSKCSLCGQHWMIAQEERIFDEFFLRRISVKEAENVLDNRWPDDFITYERVLKIGHTFATPCIFFDPLAHSLIWSAEDLRKERPEITIDEIASLLGITPRSAKRLLKSTSSWPIEAWLRWKGRKVRAS